MDNQCAAKDGKERETEQEGAAEVHHQFLAIVLFRGRCLSAKSASSGMIGRIPMGGAMIIFCLYLLPLIFLPEVFCVGESQANRSGAKKSEPIGVTGTSPK